MSSVLSRAVGLLPGRGGPRPPDTAAVLSALPVPVILLDQENRFRHVNHAAEQFLGISASPPGADAAAATWCRRTARCSC